MSIILPAAARIPFPVSEASSLRPGSLLSRFMIAALGLGGIAAAGLQSAGYIPHPQVPFPFSQTLVATAREAVDDIGPAIFGPSALNEPASASTALPPPPRPLAEAAPVRPASGLSNGPSWAFDSAIIFAPFTPLAPVEAEALASAPQESPPVQEAHNAVRLVPFPAAKPLFAPHEEAPAPPVVAGTPAPAPDRNPLLKVERQLASLPPADDRALKPAPLPRGSTVELPGPGDRYAVYDITAKVVYMPNGERLEAHSGYGAMMDDPRHISRKMRGPTPPNVYNLTMREALFHGVEAVRMNPVDGGKMFGRDGILAHSYMLGPRGDSNGCVSFADYPRFLAAFKRGEVKQMIVVARLENQPAPSIPLLSWLIPK